MYHSTRTRNVNGTTITTTRDLTEGINGRGEPVYLVHTCTTTDEPTSRPKYENIRFDTKAERDAWLRWA